MTLRHAGLCWLDCDRATGQGMGSDLFKPYQYVRESNCLTNFLDHGCFATQNLVGDKNQFAAKITKPLPPEITKPNHVLTSTGTGIHESVKQCKSRRCWEVKLSPREASSDTLTNPRPMASGLPSENPL